MNIEPEKGPSLTWVPLNLILLRYACKIHREDAFDKHHLNVAFSAEDITTQIARKFLRSRLLQLQSHHNPCWYRCTPEVQPNIPAQKSPRNQESQAQ